jgi:hypothetical protein
MPARRRRRGPHPALTALVIVVPIVLVLAGIAGAVYYFVTRPGSGLPGSGPPGRERMVGQWEASLRSGRITLNIHKEGKLDFTGVTKSGVRDTQYRTYEVSKDGSKSVTLHTTDPSGTYDPADWKLEFLGDDRMRIDFLTSGSESVIYDRKK